MLVPTRVTRWTALHDGISSSLIAVVSVVRGLFLLLSGRPRTPLRVLCIAAFDTLHVLRNGKRLSMPELKTLAVLLDFGACANAVFDRKEGCRSERRVTLQLLVEAGIGSSVADYVRRLAHLERGRPRPGGDRSRFQNVIAYREAVVRLSLGMVATAARVNPGLDEAIAATDGDGDLNLLFRIVMLCQIIDDVLDYSHDRSAGLPSFLTACQSLPQSLKRTRVAARGYADDRHGKRPAGVFPLRVARFHVSLCTRLVVFLRRGSVRSHRGRPTVKRDD